MRLSLKDSISVSGSDHNEDRMGLNGSSAWVIDGATDLLETRILPGPSDAAWFADALNCSLARVLPHSRRNLEDGIADAISDVSERFRQSALRPVAKRHEQPSAAGIVVRLVDGQLEAFSVGDCTLLSLRQDGDALDLFLSPDERSADDDVRAAAANLKAEKRQDQNAKPNGIREELMPMLRATRDTLNTDEGYGAFSIDHPPKHHVSQVCRPVSIGECFLIASDGFMRLVDLYGQYSLGALSAAIKTKGLIHLASELRSVEQDDADCIQFPRAKASDDASAMIVSIVEN